MSDLLVFHQFPAQETRERARAFELMARESLKENYIELKKGSQRILQDSVAQQPEMNSARQ